jgi:hypothetical protein
MYLALSNGRCWGPYCKIIILVATCMLGLSKVLSLEGDIIFQPL